MAEEKLERPPLHDDRLWRKEDVMNYLDVSLNSLNRSMKYDGLPSIKIRGGVRFIPEQVKAWSKKQKAS